MLFGKKKRFTFCRTKTNFILYRKNDVTNKLTFRIKYIIKQYTHSSFLLYCAVLLCFKDNWRTQRNGTPKVHTTFLGNLILEVWSQLKGFHILYDFKIKQFTQIWCAYFKREKYIIRCIDTANCLVVTYIEIVYFRSL